MTDLARRPAAPLAPIRADTDDKLFDVWIESYAERSARTQQLCRRVRALLTAYMIDNGVAGLRWLALEDLHGLARSLAGYSDGSRRTYMSYAKSLLTFGHRTGYLPFNVGAAYVVTKVEQTLAQRIMSEAEALRILDLEPDPWKHMLLRIFYASGGRVSEVCRLTWRDAIPNGKSGQLHFFGKGRKNREVLLKEDTWKRLQALRPANAQPDHAIFQTRTGNAITRARAWQIVKAAATRAGLPNVSPHWFRHAHGSHALDRGAPAHLVMETLGHADLRMTSEYAHARPTDSSARYLPI
ncbi:MAG: tyrosine-type recombinase/integrase [Kouleothrix sp.]|nr:tyrosine-type recombinase/integrase [Kouleothrix sp.]